MNNLKKIIADNIQNLRKQNKLTQAELAKTLNYTDKAISKWENNVGLPDIAQIVPLAGVLAF